MQHSESAIDLNQIRGWAPRIYTEPLDPRSAALIIVDMQKAFCRPGRARMHAEAALVGHGAPPSWEEWQEWMEQTIANNLRLLQACRQEKVRIVHVVLGCWTEDGAEMSPYKKRIDEHRRSMGLEARRQIHLPEFQIIPELAPRKGEIVLQKVTASAFTSTGLDCILRNMGMRHLVMSGTLTHGCLGATALHASDHGYDVTMVSDASIASAAAHQAWLRLFGQSWGRVRSTKQVIRELRG